MNKSEFINAGVFNKNNFDLLRLLAAFQVVIVHGILHLKVESLFPLMNFLNFFPGVPVFFFLSGLLISAAWERNSDLKSYFGNRFYRIFPALWFCVFLCTITIILLSYILNKEFSFYLLLLWSLMQSTLFPQWNPEFLNWFGIGVVNGSLWTIPVELSFYILMPILYIFSKKLKFSLNLVFTLLMLISFTIFYILILSSPVHEIQILLNKLIGFSLIPWLGMFCVGVLVQRNMHVLYPLVVNKAFIFLIIFIGMSFAGSFFYNPVLFGTANDVGILNYIFLCTFVLSFGYTNPSLSDKLLKRNDISYGVYIYHMPIFNCLILFNFSGLNGLYLGLLLILIFSLISWIVIEKPSLRKRKSFLYKR